MAVITPSGVMTAATGGCEDADARAMTVVPGQKGTAGIEEVPDPGLQDGALLVRGMAVGVCGTRTAATSPRSSGLPGPKPKITTMRSSKPRHSRRGSSLAGDHHEDPYRPGGISGSRGGPRP